MYTVMELDKICVKHSAEYEEKLDVIRSKTGLGYITSKMAAYEEPKSIDSKLVRDQIERDVRAYFGAITGKHIPYFERNGFSDTGFRNQTQDKHLKDEEESDRELMTLRLVRKFGLSRIDIDKLSMDKLIRLVERIQEGGK